MDAWFWCRLTKTGKPLSYWIDIARLRGYAVDGHSDRVFCDLPLGSNKRVAPENLPMLRKVLLVIKEGDQLGVPQLGTFGSLAVWTHVMSTLAKTKARVHDLETDRIFDATSHIDLVEGNELAARQISHLRVSAANAARAVSSNKGGRPFALTGRKMDLARLLWGTDDNKSAPEIADIVGVGVATLYRRMTHNGRIDGKPIGRQAAILLHQQGAWMNPTSAKGKK